MPARQAYTVLRMNITKTLGTAASALLAIAAFVVSIKLGIIVLVALLIVARLLRGPSESGGVIGVDQQSQARGRPRDEGNGGVGRQTFSSPWHGRP